MSDRYPYNKWQNNLIKLCLILVWRQGQLYTSFILFLFCTIEGTVRKKATDLF